MNRVFLFCFFYSVVSVTQAQIEKPYITGPSHDVSDLKGPVKESVAYLNERGKNQVEVVYRFDSTGTLLESSGTNRARSSGKYAYIFNSQDSLIGRLYYQNGKKLTSLTFIDRREDGTVSETFSFDPKGDYEDRIWKTWYSHMTYYTDGTRKSFESYNRAGKKSLFMEYDKHDNIIESKRSDARTYATAQHLKYAYEYNENGQIVRQLIFECENDSTFILSQELLATYNDRGHLIELVTYTYYIKTIVKADGSNLLISTDSYITLKKPDVSKETFSYDESGRLILTKSFASLTLQEPYITHSCVYNQQGDVMQESQQNYDNSYVRDYEFKYDQYGNWILLKTTFHRPSEQDHIVEETRIITYH